MKFSVSSSALLKHLQIVSPAIGSNPVLPILEDFHFKLESGKLTITATDLETSMITSMDAQGDGQSGEICVPAKILLDTLRELPQQPITFNVNEKNGIQLNHSHGKCKMAGEPGKDYPQIPEMDEPESFTMPGGRFSTVLSRTLFAASTDELRPAMTGLYIKPESGRIVFCCTDAHKLVKIELDADCKPGDAFIVPAKSLRKLKSFGEEVNISYNKSNIMIESGGVTSIVRLTDARYPDFNAVIPLDNPYTLTVDRNSLTGALKRLSSFANSTTNQIVFDIGDVLQISAQDLDYNKSANEEMSCDYNGDPMQIGWNVKYLLELLNSCTGEEISFQLHTPSRAGILKDGSEGTTLLLMPVMLSEPAVV